MAKARAASESTGAPQYQVGFAPVRASAARALVGQNLAIHLGIGATASRRWVVPVAAVVTAADGRSSVTVPQSRQEDPSIGATRDLLCRSSGDRAARAAAAAGGAGHRRSRGRVSAEGAHEPRCQRASRA